MHSALTVLVKSGRIDTWEFGKCMQKELGARDDPDPLLEALVKSNIVVVFEDGARKFVEFDSRAARWYAANELLEPPPASPPAPRRARWW